VAEKIKVNEDQKFYSLLLHLLERVEAQADGNSTKIEKLQDTVRTLQARAALFGFGGFSIGAGLYKLLEFLVNLNKAGVN